MYSAQSQLSLRVSRLNTISSWCGSEEYSYVL
jgi:hypothetical protein